MSYSISKFEKELYFCNIYEIVEVMLREMIRCKKGIILRRGKVSTHILSIAGPMIVAQLINVLYNVIDRIYIGRIPHTSTLAMGGLGICLPIISIVYFPP